jgi:hypothetical protein
VKYLDQAMWKRLVAAALLAATLAAGPLSASVDAASSSRGYSAPSSGSKSAAPSSSAKGYAAPPPSTGSAPGTGSTNGYALPGSAPGAAASARPAQSASDAVIARQNSGGALKSYLAQREQAKFAATAAPTPPSRAFSSYAGHYPSYDAYYSSRSAYYNGWGWSPPTYAYASRPSFGMWDALFMWFMLDSLSNASHAAWFHNHDDDPGYQQWRQEADRLAADNADLRAKLQALDASQQAMSGQPRDPSYMPADAKPDLALASENAVAGELDQHGHPNWWLAFAVLAVLGCAVYAYRDHVRRLAVHHP